MEGISSLSDLTRPRPSKYTMGFDEQLKETACSERRYVPRKILEHASLVATMGAAFSTFYAPPASESRHPVGKGTANAIRVDPSM